MPFHTLTTCRCREAEEDEEEDDSDGEVDGIAFDSTVEGVKTETVEGAGPAAADDDDEEEEDDLDIDDI